MMKILTRTAATLCVILAAQLAHSSGSAVATPDGRYQGVQASESAVWVVDTRTGQVRKCTQEFADSIPVCSGFSASADR